MLSASEARIQTSIVIKNQYQDELGSIESQIQSAINEGYFSCSPVLKVDTKGKNYLFKILKEEGYTVDCVYLDIRGNIRFDISWAQYY